MLLRALPFLLAVLLLLSAAWFCRKELYYNNPLFQLKKIETSQTDNFQA